MVTTLNYEHSLLILTFNANTDFTTLADDCERFTETLLESDDTALTLALCGQSARSLS